MDGKGSSDGGVREGWDRRRNRRRRRWRREVGGNRENEQGEASSSQAAIQEESLPIDSLHQSNQPPRPPFPPPTVRMPPMQAPPPLIARASQMAPPRLPRSPVRAPPPISMEVNSELSLYALQQQSKGALQRWERNLVHLQQELEPSNTAERTGSSHIKRTRYADNITSRTQQAALEGPVNRQDIVEQMVNQIEAQQGSTGECTEDNSDDVDSGKNKHGEQWCQML